MGLSSKDFPLQQEVLGFSKLLEPGAKNVQHPPLIESSKILLLPLHIKLILMKNFVTAMDKNGPAFRYLDEKFPGSVKRKTRRVFSTVHRNMISSEISSLIAFFM